MESQSLVRPGHCPRNLLSKDEAGKRTAASIKLTSATGAAHTGGRGTSIMENGVWKGEVFTESYF